MYEVIDFPGMFPKDTAENKPQLIQNYSYCRQSEKAGAASWSSRYHIGQVSEPSSQGYLNVLEFRCPRVHFCSQSKEVYLLCICSKHRDSRGSLLMEKTPTKPVKRLQCSHI